MNKDLFLLRGLPGSGKSTLATLLAKAVCTADDYHTDKDGNYNWDQKNIHKAHLWCQRKCELFMKRGIDRVVVANTSVTRKDIRVYEKLAEKYGYRIFSIVVENRHGGKTSHNVPQSVMESMENRFSLKLR